MPSYIRGNDNFDSNISVSFENSKTTNGYTKLPNGLILQWGIYDEAASGTQNFPIAFPNACFGVYNATQYDSNNSTSSMSINSVTTTGFYQYMVASTYSTYWLALGY